MAEYDRHIELKGAGNFRDIGGYPTVDGRHVRWRQLYRSGQLDDMGPQEARQLAGDLGVSTLIDLRHPTEGNARVGAASPALQGEGVDYRNHSLHGGDQRYSELLEEMRNYAPDRPGPRRSAEIYLEFFVVRRPDRLAAVFDTIAEASGAPVLYCTAGKDRTGISVALLLSLLGVNDEVIADDYDLSNLARERLANWSRAQGNPVDEMSDARRRAAFGVRRDSITHFLELFREQFGDARQFLTDNGVAPSSLARIEERLVE